MVGTTDPIQKHHLLDEGQAAAGPQRISLHNVLQCRRQRRHTPQGRAHRHRRIERHAPLAALRGEPRLRPRQRRNHHRRRAAGRHDRCRTLRTEERPARLCHVLFLRFQPHTRLQRLQHLRRQHRPHPLAGLDRFRPHHSFKTIRRDVRPQELRGEARRHGVSFLLRREQRRTARHRRGHQPTSREERSLLPHARTYGPPLHAAARRRVEGDAPVDRKAVASGCPTVVPRQRQSVDPHQPRRLLWHTAGRTRQLARRSTL